MKLIGLLKLDYDIPHGNPFSSSRAQARNRLNDRVWLLSQTFPKWKCECRVVRRTKHGWHAEVRISGTRKLTAVQIVALQAICGSDQKREAYNLARAMRTGVPKFWRERGNVLYSRKLR